MNTDEQSLTARQQQSNCKCILQIDYAGPTESGIRNEVKPIIIPVTETFKTLD